MKIGGHVEVLYSSLFDKGFMCSFVILNIQVCNALRLCLLFLFKMKTAQDGLRMAIRYGVSDTVMPE